MSFSRFCASQLVKSKLGSANEGRGQYDAFIVINDLS